MGIGEADVIKCSPSLEVLRLRDKSFNVEHLLQCTKLSDLYIIVKDVAQLNSLDKVLKSGLFQRLGKLYVSIREQSYASAEEKKFFHYWNTMGVNVDEAGRYPPDSIVSMDFSQMLRETMEA